MSKWSLIHLGSDIAYGMTFFAGELLKNKQEIHWFDGDNLDIAKIREFNPDYICFGPLSSEFEQAIQIAETIKKELTKSKTVFGGHHVKAVPEELEKNTVIDYLVWGPCYEVIDKILNSPSKTFIKGVPVDPQYMTPALRDYYTQVERIGKRPRTYMLSHFGCVYNCSFCCTGLTRKAFGIKNYKNHWLTRRPVESLIEEAKISKEFGMKEIGLNDDDILYDTQSGGEGTKWLCDFVREWKENINIPMYANVTPQTVIKAEESALGSLSSIVNTVQMGIETFDEGSKKLFNRRFQSEKQVIEACTRLVNQGLKVKFECIIGLPNIDNLVPDPLEDAFHTIQVCKRIAKIFPGKIKAQYNNLILFPGTQLTHLCEIRNISRRAAWKSSLYESRGSIIFDEITEKRIRNIVKMATMFIKYQIDDEWMRAIIDMDLTDSASRKFSECNYLDSLLFRIGEDMREKASDIIKNMSFKY